MTSEQMETMEKAARGALKALEFHYDNYTWEIFMEDVKRYQHAPESSLELLWETLQKDKTQFEKHIWAIADGKDLIPKPTPAPAPIDHEETKALAAQKAAVENGHFEIGEPFHPDTFTVRGNIWQKYGKNRLYVDAISSHGGVYKIGYIEKGRYVRKEGALHKLILNKAEAFIQEALKNA